LKEVLMSVSDNKELIRRFWEQVFNGRRLELIDSMFTDDYVYHGAAGQEVVGREGLKQFLNMFFNAFPDMRVVVEDVFGEGDRVASRAMCRGTHKGELMGIPPTGKQVAVRVICTNRFSGSKVAEDWELPDMFGMMLQLGVIPPPK
jgi:steroid delta-isomerase-like uncharacterized protein